MKPFIPLELFEMNNKMKINYHSNCIIIDDFYKNFDEIHDLVSMLPKEVWKFQKNSRNFIDYYDVRPTIFNFYDIRNVYENFFRNVLKKDINITQQQFIFNCFKWIKTPAHENIQPMPHKDPIQLVGLITLDKINSGGTALYEHSSEDDFDFGYSEGENAVCDISHLKINRVIPSKPNRLCIFDGSTYHAAYIQNHDSYLNNWRMNQVFFLAEKQI